MCCVVPTRVSVVLFPLLNVVVHGRENNPFEIVFVGALVYFILAEMHSGQQTVTQCKDR